MGDFEEDYLAIPPEVIRLTIKTNQKCFVTRKPGESETAVEQVHPRFQYRSEGWRQGNRPRQWQGRARPPVGCAAFLDTRPARPAGHETLAAAAIKFDLDLKKPLDQRMAKLDALNVTFHAKLGTQGERVTRIRALAAKLPKVPAPIRRWSMRAAVLAKADLRTETVGEFPELAGRHGPQICAAAGRDILRLLRR